MRRHHVLLGIVDHGCKYCNRFLCDLWCFASEPFANTWNMQTNRDQRPCNGIFETECQRLHHVIANWWHLTNICILCLSILFSEIGPKIYDVVGLHFFFFFFFYSVVCAHRLYHHVVNGGIERKRDRLWQREIWTMWCHMFENKMVGKRAKESEREMGSQCHLAWQWMSLKEVMLLLLNTIQYRFKSIHNLLEFDIWFIAKHMLL